MAETAFRGTPVTTTGSLPQVGSTAPAFELVGADLASITSADVAGQRVVLNIFPSVDTGVCAASVRRFNEIAAGLENTQVICASKDLPFALGRFCGAEGLDKVTSASAFRTSFGEDYGVLMADGPLAGLLARSVVVLDENGVVLHSQLVEEIGEEPDYDAAVAALN